MKRKWNNVWSMQCKSWMTTSTEQGKHGQEKHEYFEKNEISFEMHGEGR